MSNPYLSLKDLASLETLADANQMMVITSPAGGSGPASFGHVSLADFRDQYLLATVSEQISALEAKPGNGAFDSPITLTFAGAITGSGSFDGTENITLVTELIANSIPMYVIEDLTSTLATIQSTVEQPDLLASSYYADMNATSQTSVLGYWNNATANTAGNDAEGTVAEFTSNGTLALGVGNFVNQLCFGTAGTLNWRYNIQNGGWSIRELWHSGNFQPGDFVQSATKATLKGLTLNTTSAEAALYLQSNDSLAYQTYLYNSSRTGKAGIAYTDDNGAWAGYVFAWDRETGGVSVGGGVALPENVGVTWASGAAVTDNAGTLIITPGTPPAPILQLNTHAGVNAVAWDEDGNQSTNANVVSTAIISGANVYASQTAVIGGIGPVSGDAILDVVTAEGHLLIGVNYGTTSITSMNPSGTAEAALTFEASAFDFLGPATFKNTVNIGGDLTVVGEATWGTSDRRLKTHLEVADIQPFHRKAKLYTYDRIDLGVPGRSIIAQDIQKLSPEYVRAYNHPTGTKRPVKRLSVNKVGVALEQAYWASYEVDKLHELVEVLFKRLARLEAKSKSSRRK